MVAGQHGRVFGRRVAQIPPAVAVHFALALPATVLGHFTRLTVGLLDRNLLLPLAVAEHLQRFRCELVGNDLGNLAMIISTCSMNFCWAQSLITVSTWLPANCDRYTVFTHIVECGQSTTNLLLPSNLVQSIVLLCFGSGVTEQRKHLTADAWPRIGEWDGEWHH